MTVSKTGVVHPQIITALNNVDTELTAVLDGLTPTELNFIDGVTPGTAAADKAVVLTTGKVIDEIDFTALKIGGVAVTATATEINKACDLSTTEQTIVASGSVTAGKKAIFLNHATVAIAATIADTSLHQGLFLIKAGLEPGAGQDHTCTITTGSWNGTNKIATFADIADSLLVYFDGSGNGTILVNTGTVSLSG